MDYITLNEARAWIRISENVSDSDPKLEDCITAASRLVDSYCGRNFTVPADDDVVSARHYRAGWPLYTDDIATLTGLTVETTNDRQHYQTVPPIQYFAGPETHTVDPEPWYRIDPIYQNGPTFLCGGWMRVTAHWGWPAVPTVVKQATKLTVHWLYKRPGSPFGITSLEVMPTRISQYGDPDVCRLLNPLRRADHMAIA